MQKEKRKLLRCRNEPIKVNQKIAFFGSEIWKPRKWNMGSGQKLEIEKVGFETQEK